MLRRCAQRDVEDARVGLPKASMACGVVGVKAPNEVVLSQGSGFNEIFTDFASGSRTESRRVTPS